MMVLYNDLMEQEYPKHLYNPVRREIAVGYIRHELRKYLPSLREEKSWKKIDGDVENWFDGAAYLYPVRDFWNGFYGIMMGFKLLIHLHEFVTAENVIWEKKSVSLESLTFAGFTPRELGAKFEGMEAKTISDYYVENKGEQTEHFNLLNSQFENTFERVLDPIIVTQKRADDKDRLIIYKGNARASLAILGGKDSIEAYVGSFQGDERILRNFWVPTVLLLETTHIIKSFWKEKNEEGYKAGIVVLKKMMGDSQVAIYEMKDRVVPGDGEFEKKLRTDLGI